MSKQSNGGPVGPQKQKVTRTDLRRHSPVLYRALRALQRKHPSLTSEQLWKAVQDHWTREELNRAVVSYARTNTQTAFSKLIAKTTEVLPQAGLDGFFEADGERWGTRKALVRRLGHHKKTIRKRIDETCRSREGKNAHGYRCVFYALSDIQRVCADVGKKSIQEEKSKLVRRFEIEASNIRLLASKSVGKPSSASKGFFQAGRQVWGTVKAYRNGLKLSRKAIICRIDGSCRTRQEKNTRNRSYTFYELSDILRICADVRKFSYTRDDFFRKRTRLRKK